MKQKNQGIVAETACYVCSFASDICRWAGYMMLNSGRSSALLVMEDGRSLLETMPCKLAAAMNRGITFLGLLTIATATLVADRVIVYVCGSLGHCLY